MIRKTGIFIVATIYY